MCVYQNKLFFTALTPAAGFELWTYDKESKACAMYADIAPGPASGFGIVETSLGGFICNFTQLNGRLYFVASDSAHGMELWRIGNVNSGVASMGWDGEASLYPNPASSSTTLALKLTAAQTLAVSLTDAGGREVWNATGRQWNAGETKLEIPIAHLPCGQYFYRLYSSDGQSLASGSVLHL